MDSPRLVLKQVEIGPMMNFVYLVGCAETREAAVVDPAWDVPLIMQTARDLDLSITAVLITHAHPDHINGLEELLDKTMAGVYIHTEEMDFMRKAAAMFGIRLGFLERHPARFRQVMDGEEILIGNLAVRVLHTPGHSPGSQCFLVEKSLLTGDTLFVDACGRVDLPGGDPEKLWWSLNRRLSALESDIVVYPGHNYADQPSSTIGAQRRSNPHMQCETPQAFACNMRGF